MAVLDMNGDAKSYHQVAHESLALVTINFNEKRKMSTKYWLEKILANG